MCMQDLIRPTLKVSPAGSMYTLGMTGDTIPFIRRVRKQNIVTICEHHKRSHYAVSHDKYEETPIPACEYRLTTGRYLQHHSTSTKAEQQKRAVKVKEA